MGRVLSGALVAAVVAVAPLRAASNPLQIVPQTFDFGWCPDDAKVTSDFTVRNTGSEIVPLVAVQPACGCTASHFTPGDLSSSEETTISLTFNTRGYRNAPFTKATAVRTGRTETDYTVYQKGHVTNPEARIAPEGNGIAEFKPGDKNRQTIAIRNKAESTVLIDVVQTPADWVRMRLDRNRIAPGESANVEFRVDGSLEAERHSSATFEIVENTAVHRVTLAVRTGTAPAAPKIQAPAAPAKTKTGNELPPAR